MKGKVQADVPREEDKEEKIEKAKVNLKRPIN